MRNRAIHIPGWRGRPAYGIAHVVRLGLFLWIAMPLCVAWAEQPVDFVTEVKPIFEAHCCQCHGADKHEGGLRLDVKDSALTSGDNYAPVIRPRQSGESPLFQFISREDADLQMPPKGPRLSAREIDIIRRWIDQGAGWPASADTGSSNAKQHWAYQDLVRPPIPNIAAGEATVRTPIDRFVLARLAADGLQSSPEADRRTLIRRLYIDLLGLPPQPDAVDKFVHDAHPYAYERLVEELLGTADFGQRWARHWLDVVRFAESNGFEMNQPRPNAWHYRDYVIQSLNDDKPYDLFVREQIAGDCLGVDESTGFLVGGPWDQVKSPDPVLTAQQRADELHDMVSTTGSTFLGLTIGCGRCHAHKFDPISQIDYYAMKACLEGVQHGDRDLRGRTEGEFTTRRVQAERLRAELADLESQIIPAGVNPRLNVERFVPMVVKKIRFSIRATNSTEPCIDELEVWTAGPLSRNVALAASGAIATASSVFPGSDLHRLEHVNDGHYGNSRSWISNEPGKGWVQIQLAQPEKIDRILWGRDREEKFTDRLATDYVVEVSDGGDWRNVASVQDHREPAGRAQRRKELEQRISQLLNPPQTYSGKFVQPGPTFRFHRGDPTQVREVVAPASLGSFGNGFQLAADIPEQERRLALANWITDVRNPLTARVLVNRIWQHHFGEGIVSTPSDFGLKGSPPSHPELLNWLASEFVSSGWSMKHIHRLIVSSATYRQESAIPDSNPQSAIPNPQSIDAGNRLLWRYSPRRLEAESLRDSILVVSGVLNRRLAGPGFDLFEPNTNYVKVYSSKRVFGPEEFRRMVYQSKPRMQLEDTFGAFDCPDAGQIAPKRNSSTTPLQALSLLNSSFLIQQSEFFADRIRREAGDQPSEQARRGFRLAFQRDPSPEETSAAERLIQAEGLLVFCRALFNANEFIRID